MGEISDPYKGMKKLKKKLGEAEPEIFEKGEIGIMEGSASRRKRKGKRKKR
jgi:hypothetical protein